MGINEGTQKEKPETSREGERNGKLVSDSSPMQFPLINAGGYEEESEVALELCTTAPAPEVAWVIPTRWCDWKMAEFYVITHHLVLRASTDSGLKVF